MPEQVPFINREDEFALIDKLIREWGTLRILCINAPGGIGKTRLLQEVRKRYMGSEQTRLNVTDIIDFDDHAFHLPENVGRRIAQMLDEKVFEPYLRELLDYRKMEMAGISSERLAQAFLEVEQSFIGCFNKISDQRRIVLSIDTTDALKGTDFWDYWVRMASQLKNVLISIAGRNASNIGNSLRSHLGEDVVKIIDLPPLLEKAGETYLQKKQEILHLTLEPDLARKLLLLSGGNPIFIDLAVEWRARGISLDWLVENSLEKMVSLPEKEMEKRRQEFEKQLVLHIAQPRSQMDWLILLMSRVYPLDIEMIAALRDMPKEQAEKLFNEAKTYMFVKLLPDGRISLHDEMRRMIKDYVWSKEDPEGHRQRRESELAAKCLERKIQIMSKQIAQLEKEEMVAAKKEDAEAELIAFAEREALEREMWVLKEQHLEHTLFTDPGKGVKTFAEVFDEATRASQFSFRGVLLVQTHQYIDRLSPKQLYKLNSRRAKYLFDIGEYLQAKELATNVLDSSDITPGQQVNMLIARGNAEIRLGHVNKGISDFEEAVKISKTNKLLFIHIKSLNELGWAHRLTGNLDFARKNYQEARKLCFEQGGPDKKELQYDYGMILNNLAFVLSDSNKTRRTAIDIAHSALEHWRSIGNDIGLGAGYIVLGIACYRVDRFERGLEVFQKALDIFQPLKHNDWLGQIYSWRGALYQDMEDLGIEYIEKAEEDLKESLRIGSSNIKAMTLNRLGRVYMSQKKWDLAEEYMKKSFEHAQQIPDYVYWLGSIARLSFIAVEKGEYQRLDEFEQMLQDFRKKVENPEKNSLGMVFIGLAGLAFGKNDTGKIEAIINFLKQGISLVTEYGSYSRTDIRSRLAHVEKNFYKINPEIIRPVGKALREYVSQKESEDIDYGAVTPIMYRWANWKGGEKTDE